MSKITIAQIKESLPENWQVLSTEYKNLDTELEFKCAADHRFFSPWKKIRNKIECPICKSNLSQITTNPTTKKVNGAQRILALDQASHTTGYAIFDGVQLIKTGTFEASGANEVERIISVKQWLISMISNWKPDIIGIEGIQFQEESAGRKMGVTVFETLAHLQGVLMITAYELNIQYTICPTNTWRHACGVKGRTRADRKKSMQLLIKNWYGIAVTDDIADAIGIGYYLVNKTRIDNWE